MCRRGRLSVGRPEAIGMPAARPVCSFAWRTNWPTVTAYKPLVSGDKPLVTASLVLAFKNGSTTLGLLLELLAARAVRLLDYLKNVKDYGSQGWLSGDVMQTFIEKGRE